jgi:hypothetical protein
MPGSFLSARRGFGHAEPLPATATQAEFDDWAARVGVNTMMLRRTRQFFRDRCSRGEGWPVVYKDRHWVIMVRRRAATEDLLRRLAIRSC